MKSAFLCLVIIVVMIMVTLAENDDAALRGGLKESLRKERGARRANKRKRDKVRLNRDPTLDGRGKEKVKQYGGDRGKRKADWSADGAAGIIEGDIELARKSRDGRRKPGPDRHRTKEELELMEKRLAEKKAKRAERRIFRSKGAPDLPDLPDLPDPTIMAKMTKEERKAFKDKRKAEHKKRRKEERQREFEEETRVRREREHTRRE